MRFASVALLVICGCVGRTAVDGLACPCATGWVCCENSSVCAPDVAQCPMPSMTVEALYASAPLWNDYVRRESDDAVWRQVGTPCSGAETTIDGCFHAGELRSARVAAAETCAAISAHDELGIFAWICEEREGAVFVISTGLSPGRGLRDIVATDGYAANRLVVDRDGVTLAVSEAAPWWDNVIRALPANGGAGVHALDVVSTIYVAASSTVSDGYSVTADKIALVTLADATLSTSDATAPNCNPNTGETSTPSERCLISSGDQVFTWIEMTLAQAGADVRYFINHNASRFGRIHHTHIDGTGSGVNAVRLANGFGNTLTELSIDNANQTGVMLINDDAPRIDDLTVGKSGQSGLRLTDVDDGRFARVLVSGARSGGIRLDTSNRNTFVDIFVSSTATIDGVAGEGIRVENSQFTTLSQVVLAANATSGLFLSDAYATTLSHASILNNIEAGIRVTSTERFTASNVLIANSNDGFRLLGDNAIVHELAVAHGDQGVSLMSASANLFGGHLWLGANAVNCTVDPSGTAPGLIDGSCTDSGTDGSFSYSGQRSAAILHTGLDLTTAFVGKVDVDDSVSPDDTNGSAQAAGISFWTRLTSPFRFWGTDGGTFPRSDNRGPCETGACRIWDARLSAADTQARDVRGDFVPNTVCPSTVHGDVAIADSTELAYRTGIVAVENIGDGAGDDDGMCEVGEKCHNLFLVNATELSHDRLGDDDGLCESAEACSFSPHLGAYQGNVTSATCLFTSGMVHDVTLYAAED